MFIIKIKNYFRFNDLKTTFRNEIIGGIVTFLSMVYILSIQSRMLSQAGDINQLQDESYNMAFGGIFIATTLVTFLATLIMGLLANIPAGLAPGVGLNAILTFNVAKSGLGYQGSLFAVMIAALIFLVISLMPWRLKITVAIPDSLKVAIGIGIGFFIAYLGLHQIGLLGDTQALKNPLNFNQGLPIASLGNLKVNWPVILLGLFVFILILFFYLKKILGAIALAIVIGTIISVVITNTVKNEFIQANFFNFQGWSYAEFGSFATNITRTFQEIGNIKIWTSPIFYVSIFIFLFIDFFDSTGTFYALTNTMHSQTKLPYEVHAKALVADAVGSVVGGVLGAGTVTTTIESNAGIIAGARTGFASVITSMMFLLVILLYPLFKLITPTISGAAMLFVGILMMSQIKSLKWNTFEDIAVPFLIILIMITTLSITNGIAFGFISYVGISLMQKKYQQVNLTLMIISLLFIGYFIAWAMIQ